MNDAEKSELVGKDAADTYRRIKKLNVGLLGRRTTSAERSAVAAAVDAEKEAWWERNRHLFNKEVE